MRSEPMTNVVLIVRDRARQNPIVAAAAVGLLVLLCGILIFVLTRPPSFNWSAPQGGAWMPEKISAGSVSEQPQTSSLADQLRLLAPEVAVTAAAGATSSPDAAPSISLVVLSGSRNSLNTVQVKIAQALGAAVPPDAWTVGGINGGGGMAARYEKTDFELHGLRVDRVATVEASGEVPQEWLMVRPTPELLLIAQNLSGDAGAGEDALAAVMDQARA